MVLFSAASLFLPYWDDKLFVMVFAFAPLLFVIVPMVQMLWQARSLD